MRKRVLILGMFLVLCAALTLSAGGVLAGDRTLTNNSGTASTVWYISGEYSLVMNGFDLQTFGVALPTRVDRASISVRTPQPGKAVEVVVYQDANGGSPVDGRLAYRQTVDITTAGVFTVTFNAPVTITDRFLWVGFYLPVDFEFLADASGSSVLTYWGWEPNSTFDLANLSTADVLGPADGSAPVNINLGGIARINVELITGSSNSANTPVPGTTATAIHQIVDDSGVSLTPMLAYTTCPLVYYDNGDLGATYGYGVTAYCRPVARVLDPEQPKGYRQTGPLYDVYFFGLPSGTDPLPEAVTHCIKPQADDLTRAILGQAYGAPREWHLLPTVRFGELICAEINFTGFLSYFVPR